MSVTTLTPTQDQLSALAAAAGDPAPVVMVNLLRLRPDDGAEAYGRYAQAVVPHLERVGARVVFAAAAQGSVIGPVAPEWDLVIGVEYPSRAAFLSMVGDPDYLEVHELREAALADSRLIACAAVS
jgi:uncharacterized protein (DUF1330 family)